MVEALEEEKLDVVSHTAELVPSVRIEALVMIQTCRKMGIWLSMRDIPWEILS
jgi:hypothetical protein